MECSQRIPQLTVTLGNYTVMETFYAVDVPDMKVVLGVQWMYSLGKYSTNYQTMEMEFTGAEGQEGSIERDEYLPSHSSDIKQDEGSTPTGRY